MGILLVKTWLFIHINCSIYNIIYSLYIVYTQFCIEFIHSEFLFIITIIHLFVVYTKTNWKHLSRSLKGFNKYKSNCVSPSFSTSFKSVLGTKHMITWITCTEEESHRYVNHDWKTTTKKQAMKENELRRMTV